MRLREVLLSRVKYEGETRKKMHHRKKNSLVILPRLQIKPAKRIWIKPTRTTIKAM